MWKIFLISLFVGYVNNLLISSSPMYWHKCVNEKYDKSGECGKEARKEGWSTLICFIKYEYISVEKFMETWNLSEVVITFYCPTGPNACAYNCRLEDHYILDNDVLCNHTIDHKNKTIRVAHSFKFLPQILFGKYYCQFEYRDPYNVESTLFEAKAHRQLKTIGMIPISPVRRGSTVTIICTLSGSGEVPGNIFEWSVKYKNKTVATLPATYADEFQSELTINYVKEAHEGTYECKVNWVAGPTKGYKEIKIGRSGYNDLGCQICEVISECVSYAARTVFDGTYHYIIEGGRIKCPRPWGVLRCEDTPNGSAWRPLDPCFDLLMEHRPMLLGLTIVITSIIVVLALFLVIDLLMRGWSKLHEIEVEVETESKD